MTREDRDRYKRAAHAMQSGVAMMMNYDREETTPKHLRVGVNSAMVEHSALVKLLVEKGVITDDEYVKALADMMEKEVESYTKMIRDVTGIDNIDFA